MVRKMWSEDCNWPPGSMGLCLPVVCMDDTLALTDKPTVTYRFLPKPMAVLGAHPEWFIVCEL